MIAYVFKDYDSTLWEVVLEDGSRFKHEFFTDKKAKELIPKWYKDHHVEFVTKPWEHDGVKAAKQNYEAQWGTPWNGRMK